MQLKFWVQSRDEPVALQTNNHASLEDLELALRREQRPLAEKTRAIANAGVDVALDGANIEFLRHRFVKALTDCQGDAAFAEDAQVILKRLCPGEVREDELDDLSEVLLLRCIGNRVGAGVLSVTFRELACLLYGGTVTLGANFNDRARDFVHAEDRRLSVERNGVELVRVLRRDVGKDVEVALADRFVDFGPCDTGPPP